MKPFKINKLDMFAIKKPNLFRLIFISSYIIISLLLYLLTLIPPRDESGINAIIIFCVLFSIIWFFYPNLIVKSKLLLTLQPRNDMLLCSESLSRTNYLLSIIGENFPKQRAILCSNRISFLMDIGDFQLAKEEINLFKQYFDLDKYASTSAILFINSAIIDLYQNDISAYEIDIKKANEYRYKTKGIARASVDLSIDDNLFISSFFTTDPNFEFNVLNKKNIAGANNISTLFYKYTSLFYFSKRTGNKEKAIEYANAILQTANGNLELYDCRQAKEYLDNAYQNNWH